MKFVSLVLVLAACLPAVEVDDPQELTPQPPSTEPTPEPTPPPTQVSTPEPTPPPTSVVVPPAGGTFTLAGGVIVVVPREAVDADLTLSVQVDPDGVPSPWEGRSEHLVFEPEGATFDPPLTISIPFTGPDSEARLYWSNEYDGWNQPEGALLAGGVATFQTSHFSSGFVALNGPVEDIDITVPPPAVDVLFVIDDSCSMSEEQSQVSQNFPSFMDYFLGSGIDYHLGVVTTDVDALNPDAGLLRQVTLSGTTHRFIDPLTPNPGAVFTMMAVAGTNGAYDERGRESAYLALETNRNNPRNIDFYRPDATLHLVFLSDEEDQSVTPTGPDFLNWMDTVKATPDHVKSHTITGIPGQPCNAVITPGADYVAYANHTGGVVQDICATSWEPLMQDIGFSASGLRREFFLLHPAEGGAVDVAVFQPGPNITRPFSHDEYVYDPAGPSITFNEYVPEPGWVVRLSYTPE